MNKYYIPQFHIYDNDAEKSIFLKLSKVVNEPELNFFPDMVVKFSQDTVYTAMTRTFAKTTKIVQKPSDFGSFLWHWQVFMRVAFI